MSVTTRLLRSPLTGLLVSALLLAASGAAPALVAAADPVLLQVDRLDDAPAETACTDSPNDCSLRGALINANADGNAEIETVRVPAGTFDLTVAGDSETAGSLNVTASVVIEGAGPGLTVVDANGIDRVLTFSGGAPVPDRRLVASGLTLRGGDACAQPGGIDDGGGNGGGGAMVHGLATFTDVVVEDNRTCGPGGGLWASRYGSVLTLTRVTVRGNTAQIAGGGGLYSEFSLVMTDSTVAGNVADGSTGGGMTLAGTAAITGSSIEGNTARGSGGGIKSGDDTTSACCALTMQMSNSTISGNRATYNNTGTPSYFSGYGAGIAAGRSAITLRHVTVTGNVADWNYFHQHNGNGAGITTGYTGRLALENSIVAGNIGREDCTLPADTDFTSNGSFGCSQIGIEDPMLANLADNGGPTVTHAILDGSPVRGIGEAALCLPVDQRGVSRPTSLACDAGAYEVAQVLPPSEDLVIDDCSAPPPAVTSIAGDLIVTDPACVDVSLGTLTTIGGDMDISASATLTTIDAPELDEVGGDIDVSANATLTSIETPELDTVGGDMTLTNNPTLTVFPAPELDEVGGDIDVSANATLTSIETPELDTVGGDMTLTNNPTLTVFPAPELDEVGGDIDVSANATLTSIETPELDTVGGDVDVSENADLSTVTFGNDIEVSGSTTLTVTGTQPLSGRTARGVTSVALTGGAAALAATIPVGAFAEPTSFTVRRVGDAGLEPQDGLDLLAAYHFAFDAPTLARPATLAFTLDLDRLSAADRQATVQALAGDLATLAVRDDRDGAAYAAIPVCAADETPAADGCVAISVNDALVTFRGRADHFSTWAIVTVVPDVTDRTPPVVTVPEAVTVEATGPDGATAAFAASAVDDVDGTVDVGCDVASGSTFPLGATTVTCSARDLAGNEGSATFRVTVVDTTAPRLTVPADTSQTASGPDGAIVTFAASADDLVDGPITALCSPASGALFAVGATSVRCTATDAAGNGAEAGFRVTITALGAAPQLTQLKTDVAAAVPPLTRKLADGLAVKLDDAAAKLGQGKTADACRKVQDFVVKVTQERQKGIPAVLADDWLLRAGQIRSTLGC